MTDSLRTCIAAALKAETEKRGIYWIADFDFPFMADAVIRELRLHEENGWFGPTNIPKHRYVTEWTADE